MIQKLTIFSTFLPLSLQRYILMIIAAKNLNNKYWCEFDLVFSLNQKDGDWCFHLLFLYPKLDNTRISFYVGGRILFWSSETVLDSKKKVYFNFRQRKECNFEFKFKSRKLLSFLVSHVTNTESKYFPRVFCLTIAYCYRNKAFGKVWQPFADVL